MSTGLALWLGVAVLAAGLEACTVRQRPVSGLLVENGAPIADAVVWRVETIPHEGSRRCDEPPPPDAAVTAADGRFETTVGEGWTLRRKDPASRWRSESYCFDDGTGARLRVLVRASPRWPTSVVCDVVPDRYGRRSCREMPAPPSRGPAPLSP